MTPKQRVFLIANIIIPLVLGGLIYWITSPDTLFVKAFQSIFLEDTIQQEVYVPVGLLKYIRFYFLDMLWGYSLVFALYLLCGNSAGVLRCFLIAVVFSTAMELLQLIPGIMGTFDLLDILVEGVAEGAAAFIIFSHFKEVKG